MNNLKKYVGKFGPDFFWVFFNLLLTTIAGFFGVKLLTGILCPVEYGKLGLAISVVMIFQQVFATSINTCATRFYSVASDPTELASYLKFLQTLIRRLVLIIFILILLLLSLNTNKHIIIFTLIYACLIVISAISTGVLLGARRQKTICFTQSVYNFGRFLLAYIFLLLMSQTASVALLGFILSIIFMILIQLGYLQKESINFYQEKSSSGELHASMTAYLKPLMIYGFLVWIQLFLNRWFINYFGELDDVGLYFVYYQIGFMTFFSLGVGIARFLNPIFFEVLSDGTHGKSDLKVCKVNLTVSFIILAVTFALFLMSLKWNKSLCSLVINGSFLEGSWMLSWLILSGGIYASARQLLFSLYRGVESKKLIPISILGAIISILCNIIGGSLYGVTGIVYGGCLFSFLFYISVLLMNNREMLKARYKVNQC